MPPTLSWRRPGEGRPVRGTPRHPLLMAAEEAGHPSGGGTSKRTPGRLALSGGALVDAIRRRAVRSLPSASPSPGPDSSAPRPRQAGSPLVVIVVGGRGGSGRTALAMDVAWAFGRESDCRVLLVDADPVSPDLDVALGVVEPGRDRGRSARVDQVVHRLAELQAGHIGLGSCLWSAGGMGFQCLLAPLPDAGPQAVGREHLDYLMDHLLAPRFEVIVVDAGPITVPPALQLRFWADWATVALIPMRTAASDVRATLRTLTFLEREAGLSRESCCAVALTEPGVSGRRLWSQLSAEGLDLQTRRWSPRGASLSRARHVPMAAVDRGMASASSALVDQLGRTRHRSSRRG